MASGTAGKPRRSARPRVVPPAVSLLTRPGALQQISRKGVGDGAALLELQRMAGNRSTAELLSHLQRTITHKLPPIKKDSAELGAVRGALANYNALDDDEYQNRFNLLNVLDRSIYAWFAANPSEDLSSPLHKSLQTLMDKADGEHVALVAATKGDDTILPLDTTGLAPGDVDALKTLWRSLVEQKGNIEISGGAKFQNQVLASLGKMLGTPTGVSILEYLNKKKRGLTKKEAKERKITIVKQLPDRYKDIGSPGSESSYAISKLGAEEERAKKLGLPVTPSIANVLSETNAATFPKATGAEGLTKAILKGRKGVKMGGRNYQFGAGSGSYVVLNEAVGSDVDLHQSTSSGTAAIKPRFLTLGHELGHSFKMLAGAKGEKGVHDELFKHLQPDEKERKLWSDPEEFINITGIENKLRSESGIEERQYHKPLETVKGIRRNDKLIALIGKLKAIDHDVIHTRLPTTNSKPSARTTSSSLPTTRSTGIPDRQSRTSSTGSIPRRSSIGRRPSWNAARLKSTEGSQPLTASSARRPRRPPSTKSSRSSSRRAPSRSTRQPGANWDAAATAHENIWAVIPKK